MVFIRTKQISFYIFSLNLGCFLDVYLFRRRIALMQPSFSGLFVTWKKSNYYVLICECLFECWCVQDLTLRLLFMVYYFKVKGLQLRNKLLLSINNYSLAKPKINLISRDATRSSDKGITNFILYIPNW